MPPRPRSDDELAQPQAANQALNREKELETAKKKVSGKPATYSIVPYVGPNRTNRRPIYLEHAAPRKDRPRARRNRLYRTAILAARWARGTCGWQRPVRAAREYMAAADPDSLDQVEPYPLLIVRPNAITQYYAAR